MEGVAQRSSGTLDPRETHQHPTNSTGLPVGPAPLTEPPKTLGAEPGQQTTTPGTDVKAVFQALDVELPPKVLHLHTPTGPLEGSTPAA